jgi:hypothetical protein
MNKKIVLSIILIMVLSVFACISNKASQYVTESSPDNDYEVRLINNGTGIEIIEYKGSNLEVNIPSEIQGLPVLMIARGAFTGLKLESVTIPDGITTIGYGAFAVNNLSNVVIPNSVISIEDRAFMMNEMMTNITISNNITHIGSETFSANNLSSVRIPDSVKSIGKEAFWGSYLINITIGENVILDDDSFDRKDFISLYNSFGKQAGTYIDSYEGWIKQ